MKTIITNRKFEASDKLKATIARKMTKLDRFFPDEETANITLSTRGKLARVEITIFYKDTIFRAEQENKDVVIALYDAVDTLERQIRKNRTRLEKRLRDTAFTTSAGSDSDDFSDLSEEIIEIGKIKEFDLTEMTPEEAVLQMNLSAHNFYVFHNAENDKICVVYARDNGEYGMLIPNKA